MEPTESWLDRGVGALASAIADGRVSAEEVARLALARIEEKNPSLGAFLAVSSDVALSAARDVDARRARGEKLGKLAGVPIAIKDALCTRGVPTTCASKILVHRGQGWRPPYDATVVERLRAAGAVLVGKCNMDEFAMGSSNENSAFGPVREPVGPDTRTGRLLGRQRRGRGRGNDVGLARVRHRRLHPAARRAHRRRRREADLRSRLALRAHRVRVEPRPGRPLRRGRARRRARPRGHRRARPAGRDHRRRASRRVRGRVRSRRQRADARRARGVLRRGPRRRGRQERARRHRDAREAPGARSSPSSFRTPTTRSRRTTSSPPPRRRSNLARFDGVRFGLRVEEPRRRSRRDVRHDPRRRASGARSSAASCSALTCSRPATTTPTT